MASTARLTIDLDALAHNYAVLVHEAGAAEVAPVVKADGYGLGAVPVARRLWAEGARRFFVARVEEGEALRAGLGWTRPAVIYVLDGCPQGAAERLCAAELVPVLNSLEQAEEFAREAPSREPPTAAVHVDTGMNRLGLRPEEAQALAADPERTRALSIELVVSHLACASEPDHPLNPRQAQAFAEIRQRFPKARASLASSGGVFLGEDYLFDMVRPGISLYGGGPFDRPDDRLRAVATLEAPMLQVRDLPAGESIGYGAAFTAEAPTRVAVLAAGYADGVLRASSPDGRAWFDGALRPLLGRLSMDLIAVDVTGSEAARPGAMVELLGPHALLDDAACAAGTAAYECLVRLGPRLERICLGAVD
jgi:alanine racemase